MGIKAIVVDDEMLARENMKLMLQEFCEDIEVIGTASNIIEAKNSIKQLKPQVVFLDIRMPSGAEGFDLLDSLDKIDFEVVFVTAFKDYAIRAFKANAIDYIMKPVEIEELQKTSKKLVDKLKSESKQEGKERKEVFNQTFDAIQKKRIDHITLKHQKGIKIIEVDNITRLQSQVNYTEFHFTDGTKFLDSRTLKIYADILPKDQFMRVHKSHVVNLKEIVEIKTDQGNIIILKDDSEVPISRSQYAKVMQHFKPK